MAEIYKIFAHDYLHCCSFDEKAAQDMFVAESLGKFLAYNSKNENGKFNGYAVGKHWMDVTISMWAEDIKTGMLRKKEITDDPKFPLWWSEKILKNI